jgi:selenocysteine lyase/cysteine desulfurase
MEQMPVSMLALTGHKGLLGPQGVGLLYLAPGIELRSLRQGGTGSSSEQEQDELERPDRYECGTFNTPGIAGLGAGIQYLQEQGMERLAAHKAALTGRLYEGLAGIGGVTVYGPGAGERRGPLVAFNVASLPSSEVAAKLDHDYDIASRAGIHCAPGAHRAMGTLGRGAVRLSIGPFNTEEDIDAAVAAVTAIAAAV